MRRNGMTWDKAPAFALRAMDGLFTLARLLPVQVISRALLVLVSYAWSLVIVVVTSALYDELVNGGSPEWNGAATFVTLGALALQVAVAAVRIGFRILRGALKSTPTWLLVVDEMGFLAWAVIAASNRFFYIFNMVLAMPLFVMFGSRRRATFFVVVILVIVALILFFNFAGHALVPRNAVRWGNQYGGGVLRMGSLSFLAWTMIIFFFVLIAFMFSIAAIWTQIFVTSAPVVLIALAVQSLGMSGAGWLVSWAQWMPRWLDAITSQGYDGDVRGPLSGLRWIVAPFDLSIFGMVSMGLVLHWIPAIVRRIGNVPAPSSFLDSRGEETLTRESERSIFNAVSLDGWGGWIVLMFTNALVGLALPIYCVFNVANDPDIMDNVAATGFFVIWALIGAGYLVKLLVSLPDGGDKSNISYGILNCESQVASAMRRRVETR